MKQLLFAAIVMLFFSGCQKTKEIIDSLDPDSLHNRSVGSSANELLSAASFKSLKVEVQYMPGFAPDAGALNQLEIFLSEHLNKPGGVSIVTREIGASTKTTLTASEVHSVEKTNRSAFTTGDQMAVYVLYTNGNYSEKNVLGVAYRNTSVALFGKTIKDNSGGLGQPSKTKLEATVLKHELGHLIGLVDIGTPMKTPHKANGNHCNNQNCLMYYAAETTDILGFLVTGNVPSLDAACTTDIQANGGK